MGGLPDKLIGVVAFKAGGNLFHQILSKNPKHFAKAAPTRVQDCQLHQGNFGTKGSVIQWKYTLDGKEQSAKEVIEEMDEEKKQISFKVIEGDVLELYKNVAITFHVETNGGVDFVTWTIDYQLLNADNPHPVSLLNYFIEFTKEVDAHIFG
ncbi:hypothetical protein C2S52_009313 [Perilla frutescens var. hirtella]|nr:hypothetical protein C2S51_017187 [Perilla frutescens var. frutescens]KAH6784354.1 hypothetical protein C2S52_009313 [Perilla frutescens var. hirtella]